MHRTPFLLILLATTLTHAADEPPKEQAPTTTIRELINAASKGNAPAPNTQHPPQVAQWLKLNGESIHNTTPTPFRNLPYGTCTQKPGKLYLHVFDWPEDRLLVVPVLNQPRKAYLLADKFTPLETTADKLGLVQIKLPGEAPDKVATVIVLEIEGEPQTVGGGRTIRPAPDGSLTLLAIDAEVIARRAKLERKGENPHNIGYWTDVNDHVQWDVSLTKPGRYEIHLEYSAAPNSAGSEYAVEVLDQSIKSRIEATRSFLDFKTIPLGVVIIKEPSTGKVTVRPLTKPGVAVMDLRKLVLRPL